MKSKLQEQADDVRALKETADALDLVYQAEVTKLGDITEQIQQLENQRNNLWTKIRSAENDRNHANIRLSQHLDQMKELCDENNPHRGWGKTNCAKQAIDSR